MNEKRAFRGVWIPAEIWLTSDLSAMEKLILTEIDSLDNKDGCIAGNPYFASFFGISTRQVRNYVASLRDKKYIIVIPLGQNHRRILMAKKFRQVGRKLPPPDGRKLPHSNTLNNIYINKENVLKIKEMKKSTFQGKRMASENE